MSGIGSVGATHMPSQSSVVAAQAAAARNVGTRGSTGSASTDIAMLEAQMALLRTSNDLSKLVLDLYA